MRKFLSDFVLICLLVQMVIFVLMSGPQPAAPRRNSQPRYVQRSLAESAARNRDAEFAVLGERSHSPEHRDAQAGPPSPQLQNVSLPLTEPGE